MNINPGVIKEIEELVSKGKLEFYDKKEDVVELIVEVLKQNPHSKSAIEGKRSGIFALALDNMEVIYKVNTSFNEFEVLKVIECKDETRIQKLRTKEWVEDVQSLLSK